MDAKTIPTGLASFAMNVVGFATTGQSQPLINPAYGEPLKAFLSTLPYVGPWFAQVSPSLLLFGASFLLVWIVMAATFSMLPGWMGPVFAFGVGILAVLFITGNLGGLVNFLSGSVPVGGT
jgi:hypothetical protein